MASAEPPPPRALLDRTVPQALLVHGVQCYAVPESYFDGQAALLEVWAEYLRRVHQERLPPLGGVVQRLAAGPSVAPDKNVALEGLANSGSPNLAAYSAREVEIYWQLYCLVQRSPAVALSDLVGLQVIRLVLVL